MSPFGDRRRALLRLTGAAAAALALPAAAQNGSGAGKRGEPRDRDEQPASPAEDLMHDHGLLDRVLLVYEETLRRMNGGDQVAQLDVVGDAAGIVRDYVEGHHEKLEEAYIFPRFERAQQQTDLVKVLREQHAAGRRLTEKVSQLAKSSGALKDPVQRLQLESAMRDFIRMYRPHESREDTVLLPALRKMLSRGEYQALGAQFRKSERDDAAGSLEMMVERVATLERQIGVYDLAKFTPRI
jgi:hemerythrin-like domain-containing protein